MKINATLEQFEADIGFGSTVASRILGCSYSAYARYRSGARAFPLYHQRHLAVIYRLSRAEFDKLVREHTW
jgi:hypothetical protein